MCTHIVEDGCAFRKPTLPPSQLAPLVYYISRPNAHEFTRLRVGKDSLIIQQLCQQVVSVDHRFGFRRWIHCRNNAIDTLNRPTLRSASSVPSESEHALRGVALDQKSADTANTGSTYKRLGVPGEEDFIGAGVHFCATCDGPFYKGREVVVIGGGNSAVEEAAFLTRFCPKVTILVRGSELTASKVAVDKANDSPEMEIRFNTVVAEFKGKNNRMDAIVVKNTKTGETEEMHPAGVFVFVGLSPNSKPFKDIAKVDAQGFIMTGIDFQTSTEGIFAAGDVRSGSTKQLVSAAGEGAAAALAIREHLRGHDAHTMEKALVGTALN